MKHKLANLANRYPALEYFMQISIFFIGSAFVVLLLTLLIGLIYNA